MGEYPVKLGVHEMCVYFCATVVQNGFHAAAILITTITAMPP